MTNQSSLSDLDTSVVAEVDPRRIVDLARELVRFPSFKGEETELAHWLGAYFEERGYEVEMQEVQPGRFQTIATLKGTGGGRSLMLNGHLDIDPLAHGWTRDPFELHVEGDRISAAGIINMKGSDATMIEAAEAVRRAGVRLRGDLVIACVAGELQGGFGTHHLMQTGFRTDMAIVTEPLESCNVLTTHAGVMSLAVSVIGRSEHIMYRARAIDAIEKMMKVIPALKAVEFACEPRADLPELPILQVGCIIGGRGRMHDLKGPNYVCDYCTVLVDVRYLPGQTPEGVRADIETALARLQAEDRELEYEIEVPPPARFGARLLNFDPTEVPTDEYIVQAVARHYETLTGTPPASIGVQLPGSYGGMDLAHLWKAGIPSVVYGPTSGEGIRSAFPGESMSVSDMALVAKVLALCALDVCEVDGSAA